MKHEGMVHALQEIHRLLRPAACLIDIHPARAPTLIEVHHLGEVLFTVPVPGQTFEDIDHADHAISQVASRDLYTVEQVMAFELRTYAVSTGELRDYLAHESAYDESPSSEMLALEDAAIVPRVEALLKAYPQEAQLVRLNPARISRLRPMP